MSNLTSFSDQDLQIRLLKAWQSNMSKQLLMDRLQVVQEQLKAWKIEEEENGDAYGLAKAWEKLIIQNDEFLSIMQRIYDHGVEECNKLEKETQRRGIL